MGVFRKEAVAWVDRLGPCLHGSFDYVVYLQIALPRRRRTHKNSLIGVLGEQGILVRLRIDGHGGDSQLPAGSHDPYGYLPPVGDQDLVEHPQVNDSARVKTLLTILHLLRIIVGKKLYAKASIIEQGRSR